MIKNDYGPGCNGVYTKLRNAESVHAHSARYLIDFGSEQALGNLKPSNLEGHLACWKLSTTVLVQPNRAPRISSPAPKARAAAHAEKTVEYQTDRRLMFVEVRHGFPLLECCRTIAVEWERPHFES